MTTFEQKLEFMLQQDYIKNLQERVTSLRQYL